VQQTHPDITALFVKPQTAQTWAKRRLRWDPDRVTPDGIDAA